MIVKLLGVECAAIVAAGTSGIDGTANRIILYSAAGAGLFWLWRHLLVPIAKLVRRTVASVEHLEELPALAERVTTVENDVAAIVRDLDISPRSGDRRDHPA